MKLKQIFKKIQTDSSYIDRVLSSEKGEEFEKRILSSLLENGDYAILKNDELKSTVNFKEFKKRILVPNYSTDGKMPHFEELEKFKKSPRVVYQPFGEKSAPDLLLIKEGKCLALEIKFTVAMSKVPLWNSGLTRPDMLYMFGSHGRKEIAFFKGSSIINIEEYKELKGWADNLKLEVQDHANKLAKNFNFYMRSMFNQEGDLFLDKHRKGREEIAIEWAMFF